MPPSATIDPILQSYRGEPFTYVHDQIMRNIAHCKNCRGLDLDLSLAAKVWEDYMHEAKSLQRREPEWFHADLVEENLLVNDDGLAGVLDFGSLGAGGPTADFQGTWEVWGQNLMSTLESLWTRMMASRQPEAHGH